MIIKVFIWGMIAAPFAVGIEYLFLYVFGLFEGLQGGPKSTYAFLGIAFIEEWLKYRVVLKHAETNPAFDEPVDAMIYLIVAALGFAAVENILYIVPLFGKSFFAGLGLTVYRFVGATFLHTLASGIIGYFLALNFFLKKPKYFLGLGILIGTGFHTFYNCLIIKTESLGMLTLFLAFMAVIVLKMFEDLKKCESARESEI